MELNDELNENVDDPKGRRAVGVVNSPNLAGSMVDGNKAWMHLAQALGYVAQSLAPPSFTSPDTLIQLVAYGTQIHVPRPN